MKDQSKTKQVLIQELAILRQRVEELEQSESEWKKEKEELKKSESLFRSYFDLPLYGIAITSPEKGWIQVNDRICSIMGYSRDEIVCKTWSEMTYPDDLAAEAEQFSRVLSGKIDQYNMCKRFIRKDGEVIWTNLSVGCVRNSDSSVDHMVAMVEDITSVKLAEEALRQERMLYEDLVTTEPAGVYRLRVKLSGNWQAEPWSSIVKSRYSVDMASDRYCNILGISHEEFMKNAGLVRDLIHPDDKQGFDVLNTEAITRLSPFTWEGRIIRDHQTRWIHFESLPRVLDSETVLWTGIVYDITERKQMEEALQVSEIKYRKLYQSMMDAYVSTDMEGYIRDYNRSYLNMLGYAPEEISTLTYKDITPEKWHMMEDAIVEKQVLTKGYSDIYEKEYRRKDGTTFPVELRSMLLRDTDGTPISMWAIVRDITERKRAAEYQRELEERLQRAEKMEALGTLAGGVAHDLNNVLGIVVGYSEMLLDEIDESSPLRNYVMKIMEGGQRSAAIVQDLLTLARRGVSGRKVLNLNKLILDDKKSPEWEKLLSYHPSVQIKTDLEADLLNISASSVHLEKALFNLASNACEAMTKGGCVTIRTTNQYLDKPMHGYDNIREGDYVVLSVSDTGEGIPESDLKRIFEPFYTKKIMGRSGTGLGLAVVWGTVKDHHGYINVESEEGKGSIFTLYFPAAREDITAESLPVSINEYMGKGESILVVDDVKGQRDLAAAMLKKLNYKVASVSSGEDAVEYLREHDTDLMVLDMIMDPGMDGLDTYRNVLKIHPKQKAIILSGFSESDQVHDAQALGAGAYVRKPYVIEKLGLAVREELDRK